MRNGPRVRRTVFSRAATGGARTRTSASAKKGRCPVMPARILRRSSGVISLVRVLPRARDVRRAASTLASRQARGAMAAEQNDAPGGRGTHPVAPDLSELPAEDLELAADIAAGIDRRLASLACRPPGNVSFVIDCRARLQERKWGPR